MARRKRQSREANKRGGEETQARRAFLLSEFCPSQPSPSSAQLEFLQLDGHSWRERESWKVSLDHAWPGQEMMQRRAAAIAWGRDAVQPMPSLIYSEGPQVQCTCGCVATCRSLPGQLFSNIQKPAVWEEALQLQERTDTCE